MTGVTQRGVFYTLKAVYNSQNEQTTATGLSSLLDGGLSHDKVSRFLADREYTSKGLWKEVKFTVRAIASEQAVLIVDDTIHEKPHSDESELICWHYDHCTGLTVKGINLLHMVYTSGNMNIPVAFELVKKPFVFFDIETHKEKRKSDVTKNTLMQQMLSACSCNQSTTTRRAGDVMKAPRRG